MIGDTILIIFISITTALLGEGSFDLIVSKLRICFLIDLGLTWLLVYRTEKYQRLKGEVEKASKRRKLNVLFFIQISSFIFFIQFLVERQKETVSEAADKVQKRKLGSSIFELFLKIYLNFRTSRRKIES
jgi:hypothetical protein